RPVDVIVRAHPLRDVKHELAIHGHCVDLVLPPLTEMAVAELLRRRGDVADGLPEVARAIHRRTEGNPLFVVNGLAAVSSRVDLSAADGRSAAAAVEAIAARVPDTLRQMIEGQLERLDAGDRALLEVASVAGPRFSTALIAAGLDVTALDVETRCAALA